MSKQKPAEKPAPAPVEKVCEACGASAPQDAHACPLCGSADWQPNPVQEMNNG